jgi:uncharacterized protein
MTKNEFYEIEAYMLSQMQDSAHDKHHVYRVLNFALDIAATINPEDTVSSIDTAKPIDTGVLIAACLLHDIGREKRSCDINLCHAQVGGEMARDFLISRKWPEPKALHVKDCVATHRYRRDNLPQSIEAQILFDADKLEASGAMGIARTLIYGGQVTEPLYIIGDGGKILTEGGGGEISSFFQEYNYKLKNVYTSFFTARANEIAANRQKTAVDFYNGLYSEISSNYENGLIKHMTSILT